MRTLLPFLFWTFLITNNNSQANSLNEANADIHWKKFGYFEITYAKEIDEKHGISLPERLTLIVPQNDGTEKTFDIDLDSFTQIERPNTNRNTFFLPQATNDEKNYGQEFLILENRYPKPIPQGSKLKFNDIYIIQTEDSRLSFQILSDHTSIAPPDHRSQRQNLFIFDLEPSETPGLYRLKSTKEEPHYSAITRLNQAGTFGESKIVPIINTQPTHYFLDLKYSQSLFFLSNKTIEVGFVPLIHSAHMLPMSRFPTEPEILPLSIPPLFDPNTAFESKFSIRQAVIFFNLLSLRGSKIIYEMNTKTPISKEKCSTKKQNCFLWENEPVEIMNHLNKQRTPKPSKKLTQVIGEWWNLLEKTSESPGDGGFNQVLSIYSSLEHFKREPELFNSAIKGVVEILSRKQNNDVLYLEFNSYSHTLSKNKIRNLVTQWHNAVNLYDSDPVIIINAIPLLEKSAQNSTTPITLFLGEVNDALLKVRRQIKNRNNRLRIIIVGSEIALDSFNLDLKKSINNVYPYFLSIDNIESIEVRAHKISERIPKKLTKGYSHSEIIKLVRDTLFLFQEEIKIPAHHSPYQDVPHNDFFLDKISKMLSNGAEITDIPYAVLGNFNTKVNQKERDFPLELLERINGMGEKLTSNNSSHTPQYVGIDSIPQRLETQLFSHFGDQKSRDQGTVFMLTGESGNGKTSIVKTIVDLMGATSITIHAKNREEEKSENKGYSNIKDYPIDSYKTGHALVGKAQKALDQLRKSPNPAKVLVIDEIDQAPALFEAIQAATDESDQKNFSSFDIRGVVVFVIFNTSPESPSAKILNELSIDSENYIENLEASLNETFKNKVSPKVVKAIITRIHDQMIYFGNLKIDQSTSKFKMLFDRTLQEIQKNYKKDHPDLSLHLLYGDQFLQKLNDLTKSHQKNNARPVINKITSLLNHAFIQYMFLNSGNPPQGEFILAFKDNSIKLVPVETDEHAYLAKLEIRYEELIDELVRNLKAQSKKGLKQEQVALQSLIETLSALKNNHLYETDLNGNKVIVKNDIPPIQLPEYLSKNQKKEILQKIQDLFSNLFSERMDPTQKNSDSKYAAIELISLFNGMDRRERRDLNTESPSLMTWMKNLFIQSKKEVIEYTNKDKYEKQKEALYYLKKEYLQFLEEYGESHNNHARASIAMRFSILIKEKMKEYKDSKLELHSKIKELYTSIIESPKEIPSRDSFLNHFDQVQEAVKEDNQTQDESKELKNKSDDFEVIGTATAYYIDTLLRESAASDHRRQQKNFVPAPFSTGTHCASLFSQFVNPETLKLIEPE